MTPLKRQAILLGAAGLIVVAATLASVNWMFQQREAAQSAADETAACRQLARTIESLRTAPKVAATGDADVQDLGARIKAAAGQAGLAESAVEGVFPQSARRLGDSPYLQKPVAMSLRGVTLDQLATFLYGVAEGSSLTVRDLRLRAPHGDAARNLWDADATLTCLFYEPAAKPARGNRETP
jgi:hypothetical protein